MRGWAAAALTEKPRDFCASNLVLLQISLFTLFVGALANQNPGEARPASAELGRGLSTFSLAVVEDEGGF